MNISVSLPNVNEADAEKLRILIAEDNEADRILLERIVSNEGHTVYVANDGQQAVELFKGQSPDIVLLDAMMPTMDGFKAAEAIKHLAGDSLVPIIFLTQVRDSAMLADCFNSGGIDFLNKPYNPTILYAKIKAYAGMRRLHETAQRQRDEIALHHDRLIHEQEVAKQVFDKIAHPGCSDASNIKFMLSPMAVFNGDLVLVARKPSGGMCVFLGDFTGHGLPAAIGAMPVSEIFYGMTQKGFSLPDIMLEINKKLKRVLPVGVFCCACMVDMSFRKRSAEIWIGGLPDVLVYRDSSHTVERLSSQHLPLGVVDNSRFNVESRTVAMAENDKLLMFSDGIVEAQNAAGEMFGEEGIINVVEASECSDDIFGALEQAVAAHATRSAQDDDYTLVEVTMVKEADIEVQLKKAGESSIAGGPRDWSMEYKLRGSTLRDFNPLPVVTHLLMEVPGLRPFSGKLYTILAELFSNALEHGVLGLASSMKASADGFAQYYDQRQRRLEVIESGFVRFHFDHQPTGEGGCLVITVEDSGGGFDYAEKNQALLEDSQDYSGRGIPLVRHLCESVKYQGKGNQVEAVFNWKADT